MAHGHDVLHFMEGQTFSSKENLVEAIVNHFGTEERFHTCSAEGMDAATLVDFLSNRNKFITMTDGSITVDTTKICNH